MHTGTFRKQWLLMCSKRRQCIAICESEKCGGKTTVTTWIQHLAQEQSLPQPGLSWSSRVATAVREERKKTDSYSVIEIKGWIWENTDISRTEDFLEPCSKTWRGISGTETTDSRFISSSNRTLMFARTKKKNPTALSRTARSLSAFTQRRCRLTLRIRVMCLWASLKTAAQGVNARACLSPTEHQTGQLSK